MLLKDAQVRNEWPVGVVVNTFPAKTNVQKVDVKVVRQGAQRVYSRPVSEVVLLVRGGCNKARSQVGSVMFCY